MPSPMANQQSPRRFQCGYLLEIPIILFILVIVLSFVVPRLPLIGQRLVIVITAIPIVLCLFYMIIVPGWAPGSHRRGISAWRVALFLGCAAVIATGVGALIFR
jgi:hypothetical protein